VSGLPAAAIVTADDPVEGVTARVAGLPADLDDEAAGALLRDGLAADGLSLPAERGLPDVARRIVARLRGRQLLDDLGRFEASFELYGLHVPPQGRAALALRRDAITDRQISVTALGLGFGGGRKLTLAIDEDIPERGACMCVLQEVVLNVRRFAAGGEAAEPLLTTDVTAWGPRQLTVLGECPYCRTLADGPDPLDYEQDLGAALDLRSFDGPVTRKTTYTLEGSSKADVGLAVPVPGGGTLQAGFALEQQVKLECTASYTFPPGRLFVPYRRRGAQATLPYWAVQ
jgi:hypothetical protein